MNSIHIFYVLFHKVKDGEADFGYRSVILLFVGYTSSIKSTRCFQPIREVLKVSIYQLKQDELDQISGGVEITTVKGEGVVTLTGTAETTIFGVVEILADNNLSIANINAGANQERDAGAQGIFRE